MKTKLQFLLFCFTLFSISSVYADPFSIATFNCEFLTTPKVHIKHGLPFKIKDAKQAQQNQWNQEGFRDGKYLESAKEVAKVIRAINADIIALTEVGSEQDIGILIKEIRLLGIDYAHSVVGDSRDRATHQNVAVLSKFSLSDLVSPIPGRELYIQELDDPETEKDTGISKGLRVKVLVQGKSIIVYVLHFSSERGGHEKDAQRIAQASIARRHMLPNLNNNELIIVVGDLNEKRGQPTLHRIRGLDDVYPDLIQTGLPQYFEKNKIDTRWTYIFQGIRQQIDHVLISYGLKDIAKRGGIKVHTLDHGNSKASDHRALIVSLDLKN